MGAIKQIVGTCLCKAVTVQLSPEKNIFDACHCGICRKWGGGPAFTIEGNSTAQLSGEKDITVYNSSDWAERGFCKQCGTHLFYRLKDINFWTFSAGLFKEVENFNFHVQIYIDAKPSCYEFANKTEMLTEAQVVAKFQEGNKI